MNSRTRKLLIQFISEVEIVCSEIERHTQQTEHVKEAARKLKDALKTDETII